LRHRRRGLGARRPIDQHAVEHQAGARCDDKCKGQYTYESFIHLNPCFARLDPPAPVAGLYVTVVLDEQFHRNPPPMLVASLRVAVVLPFSKLLFPKHTGDDR
jgi:hypothetical protein